MPNNTLTIANAGPATQAEIRNIGLQPSRFSITVSGPNAIAYDSLTGVIAGSGSDHALVINNVIALLTALRTKIEYITIYGSYNINSEIIYANYTGIRLDADFTVTGNNSVFSSTGRNNISLFGGYYNLPLGSLVSQNVFTLDSTSNFEIDKLTTTGSGSHAISIKNSSSSGSVRRCIMDLYGDDGVSIVGSSNIDIVGNTLSNGRSASGGSSGVEVEDTSFNMRVLNNECFGNQQGILSIIDPATNFVGNSVIEISYNDCHDNTSNGIACNYAGNNAITSLDHTVSHNLLTNNVNGIFMKDCPGSFVSYNQIHGVTGPTARGIDCNADGVTIDHNSISETQGNAIQVTGIGNDISYNRIRNAGLAGTVNEIYGIRLASTNFNSKVLNNRISDTQGTPTTAGINSFNGDNTEIAFNHFSNLANLAGPGTRAVYEQASNGPVHIHGNTSDTGDAVVFKTELSGQTGALASPIVISHGLNGATGLDTVVNVTAKTSGVTQYSATIDSNNLTITYAGPGTADFYYDIKTSLV